MTRRARPTDAAATWRAAFDVLVYAPIGLGAMLVEDGPAAMTRARQELRNARFIGRLTVDQGIAQMPRRLDTDPVADDAPDERPPLASTLPDVGDETPTVEPEPETAVGSDDLPVAGDLALPDYDTLPAIDIVAKLDTLGTAERAAIERYETAHRQRRTVLGKLAQLGVA